VPRFEPFPGIRYAPGRGGLEVLAPPYDVLGDADRAALASRSDHNIVHLDVPVGPDGYALAGRLLSAWQADGALVTDPTPTFSAYRMSFTDARGIDQATTGVIGALELMRPGDGDVLPHERTTPKAKSDRLQLLQATAANLSAVWGLSLAPGVAALVDGRGETLLDVTDEDGIHHEVRRVADPATLAAVSELVGSAPVVIADGHHRYETSLAYRNERRAAAGGAAGPYDLTMAFVVELSEEHLHVEAIHRLVTGLPPGVDLVETLRSFFEPVAGGRLDRSTTVRMAELGALCLVHPDGAVTFLRPRPSAFEGTDDLDTARLDAALAAVPHVLAYQHGTEQILDALGSARAQFGILVRPVPVATIARFAHERRLMPPKSTFFAPKPKTGLVLRSLG